MEDSANSVKGNKGNTSGSTNSALSYVQNQNTCLQNRLNVKLQQLENKKRLTSNSRAFDIFLLRKEKYEMQRQLLINNLLRTKSYATGVRQWMKKSDLNASHGRSKPALIGYLQKQSDLTASKDDLSIDLGDDSVNGSYLDNAVNSEVQLDFQKSGSSISENDVNNTDDTSTFVWPGDPKAIKSVRRPRIEPEILRINRARVFRSDSMDDMFVCSRKCSRYIKLENKLKIYS